MLPYIIMVEEHLRLRDSKYHKISTWNQASIGAALAAAVEADKILRGYSKISIKNKELLSRLFYKIGKNFRGAKDFVVEDYGKILNGDSVQARAKDLYNYISNDLKILQINEKEFINKFSRESMISKYIQLYNSL